MPHQQRSEETRARILAAALHCFSRTGYDATGVAEICIAAGVSKGAFYHHFPSKQAVFVELLNAWLQGLDTQFATLRMQTASVPETLRAMAATIRQVFSDARGQLPMFLEFWTQATREPLLWEKTVEPYRRYEMFFADLVRAGIAEGSLQPVDPEATARTLIALAVGLLVQAMSNPDDSDWARTTIQGMDMILTGIEARPKLLEQNPGKEREKA
ncbi:MAG TPA: TetR/AcrR family transcriptional regulator [Anaerolineaceae bacterium]